ncbi:hypothetical protein CHS0354_038619 [Potamilus streckersoni]|uniref:Uncharacterized protein n=1 Tax=Potamilus streckersoni TaxID=2493646 RepID=A0AAE0WCI6_9BIVA|nr:hypothetical protein CHS0354_038619 [Potamilus streckersoni]
MWTKTVALVVVAIVIGSNSVSYCGVIPLTPVNKNATTAASQAEKTSTSKVSQTTKGTPQDILLNSSKTAALDTFRTGNAVTSFPTGESKWNPSTEMASMTSTDTSFNPSGMAGFNGFAGLGSVGLSNTATVASFGLHEVMVLNDVLL